MAVLSCFCLVFVLKTTVVHEEVPGDSIERVLRYVQSPFLFIISTDRGRAPTAREKERGIIDLRQG